MTEMEFGSSIGSYNFLIDECLRSNGSDIFDGILNCGGPFISDFENNSKDPLSDLPTPTLPNDDVWEKLLRDLDDQQKQQNQQLQYQQFSSSCENNCSPPFLQDDFVSYYSSEMSDNSSSPPNAISSPPSSTTSPPMIFADTPPLGETVEIELTQEHSYAAPVCPQQRSPSSSNVAAVSLSPFTDGVHSPDCRSSPFSSRTSHRSSCSISDSTTDQQTSIYPDITIDIIEEALKSVEGQQDTDDDDEGSDRDDNSTPFVRYLPLQRKDLSSSRRGSNGRRGSRCVLPFSSHDITDDSYLAKYPTLVLSDEEKVLCDREGVKLPTKFPLTRQEEKDLKRIRRKIRNKKSAQESRRKRQDYVNALEHRVKSCDRDNQALKRQVELLSQNNSTLLGQLRKLQAAVGNGNRPAVQAGTCLAVLLLSFALLVAPNYSPFGKRKLPSDDQNNSVTSPNGGENANSALLPGNTRTLLQSRGLVGTDDENVADVENGNVGRVLNKIGEFAIDVPMYDDKGDNVSVDDWYGNQETKPDAYLGIGWMNEMKNKLVVDADRRKLNGLRRNGDDYPSSYLSPPPSKRLKTGGDISSSKFAQMPSVERRNGDESNGVDDNNDTKTRVYVTRSTAKQIKVEEL